MVKHTTALDKANILNMMPWMVKHITALDKANILNMMPWFLETCYAYLEAVKLRDLM